MAPPLTCDDVLVTEDLERGSYVKMADGSFAKRIVLVEDGEAMDCDDALESTETIIRGSYVVLSPGQYAQQVLDVT